MQRIYRTPARDADPSSPRLVLEVDGRALCLSDWLADVAPLAPRTVVDLAAHGFFERASLENALRRGRWRELPTPPALLVPVEPERVGKLLALGKNFREHAAEFGEAVPEEPLFFNKLPETLRAHGERVRVPSWYTARVDHEAELAVVIGKQGWEIDEARAMEHVAGYSVANDLTARTLQKSDRELKYPWFRAKNLEGFCPLGPCFVPRDALDISDLAVTARVRHRDGSSEERQRASTRDLIVSVPQALAWLSRHLTLRVGDIVLMGTPAGVGPLVDGDVVTCAVEGIGELATPIER
ncbi:MAG: fumarylacetoacetate hydrolase family protein [Planctomycetes bacterium]|nr:fumarylacetoacetate hydrolase family protein [Planctomycetota bacterium]